MSEHLREAAAQRRLKAESQAIQALAAMSRHGETVNFVAVARKAAVSTDFLYRHPTLRAQVVDLRRATSGIPSSNPPAPALVTSDTSSAVRSLAAQLKGAACSSSPRGGAPTESPRRSARRESSASSSFGRQSHRRLTWSEDLDTIPPPAGAWTTLRTVINRWWAPRASGSTRLSSSVEEATGHALSGSERDMRAAPVGGRELLFPAPRGRGRGARTTAATSSTLRQRRMLCKRSGRV